MIFFRILYFAIFWVSEFLEFWWTLGERSCHYIIFISPCGLILICRENKIDTANKITLQKTTNEQLQLLTGQSNNLPLEYHGVLLADETNRSELVFEGQTKITLVWVRKTLWGSPAWLLENMSPLLSTNIYVKFVLRFWLVHLYIPWCEIVEILASARDLSSSFSLFELKNWAESFTQTRINYFNLSGINRISDVWYIIGVSKN